MDAPLGQAIAALNRGQRAFHGLIYQPNVNHVAPGLPRDDAEETQMDGTGSAVIRGRSHVEGYQGLLAVVATLIAAGVALLTSVITASQQDRGIEAHKSDQPAAFARGLLRDVDQAMRPRVKLRDDLGDPAKLRIPDDPTDRAAYLGSYEIDIPGRFAADPLLLELPSAFAQRPIDQLARFVRRYNQKIEAAHDAQSLKSALDSTPNVDAGAQALSNELERLMPGAEPTNEEILSMLQAPLSVVGRYEKYYLLDTLKKRCKAVTYDDTQAVRHDYERVARELTDIACYGDGEIAVPP
jgi:hypothetical protein